jgi:hypothetical protein
MSTISPRSVRKPSTFCNANETEENHENHRPQQMTHRRKWNHGHTTCISTNLWVSTFSKARNVHLCHCTWQGHQKTHSYTLSCNDAIRAYGWRCVKVTFIRGLWPNTGLFCLLNAYTWECQHLLATLCKVPFPYHTHVRTLAANDDGYCGVGMNFCTWQKHLDSFALRPTCSPWEEFREHVGQKTANFTAAWKNLFTVKIVSTLAKNKIPGPLRRK